LDNLYKGFDEEEDDEEEYEPNSDESEDSTSDELESSNSPNKKLINPTSLESTSSISPNKSINPTSMESTSSISPNKSINPTSLESTSSISSNKSINPTSIDASTTQPITVKVCNKSDTGKRIWDKQNYCIFCINDAHKKTAYSKLARHIEMCHKNEREVIELSFLQPKDGDSQETKTSKLKKRKLLFEQIRKKGNFAHNSSVLNDGKGELVVEKSPSDEKYIYKDFLPCEYCFAFYHEKELYKHVSACHFAPVDAPKNRRVKSLAAMLLYQSSAACNDLQDLLSHMLVDDVSMTIRKDECLLRYGNSLCRRHWNNNGQNYHISNKLRELARLLNEVRQICDNVHSFKDCIDCTKFEFVVQACTNLCGWDEETGTITTPSIGIKLGHSLKKISKILKGEALVKNDVNLKMKADDFYELIDIKWNDEISKCARTELEKRKWNKVQMIPFTEDIKELHESVKKISNQSINLLAKDNSNLEAWRNLATSTLSRLLLFNRRRSGEPAKITISDFQAKVGGIEKMNEEIKSSLSSFELQLCSSLKRVEIRGKRGRKVPLIFTADMERAVGLLISLRKSVGVSEENKFVFAVPNGSIQHIRGPDALRKHVKNCNIKNPHSLTTTNLRKHIATLSQILNLSEHELELLANHLGHDITIHREYYRLPESTLNLAKVGKILLAFESGIGEYSGKSLQEIAVDLGIVYQRSF